MTILTAKKGSRLVQCDENDAANQHRDSQCNNRSQVLGYANEIHVIEGTQAIAAMALGTESISKVDVIAGPGNPFVADTKRQLFGEVDIGLLAGPTEVVLIVADEAADPFTLATDLLSQAKHGPDTSAVLITTMKTQAGNRWSTSTRLCPMNGLGEVDIVENLVDGLKLCGRARERPR